MCRKRSHDHEHHYGPRFTIVTKEQPKLHQHFFKMGIACSLVCMSKCVHCLWFVRANYRVASLYFVYVERAINILSFTHKGRCARAALREGVSIIHHNNYVIYVIHSCIYMHERFSLYQVCIPHGQLLVKRQKMRLIR